MDRTKKVWLAGLLTLACTAAAAYGYSVVFMAWNVPLYGVGMALFFLLGAVGFALLAAAKGKTGKRLAPAALLGGAGTVGGVSAISYAINIIIFHEKGARFASLATAAFGAVLALYGVIRLTALTKTRRAGKPLLGVLLALAVFAAGFSGTVSSDLFVSPRFRSDALRAAAAKELSAATEKLYGTDALRREDGTLTVAFIGGSLTQGRITYRHGKPRSTNAWTDDVLQFLAEKYPQKTLRAVNAAKGGTNSQYGAARFGHDVEPYAPDLLFIEFSVNDCGSLSCEPDSSGAAQTQLYLEYMLRRCLQMKKEPAVIYLHTPYPTDTDTDNYRRWKEGADLKTALCGYYGIPVVNIYDTLHDAYEQSGTALPLTDWLADNGWYNRAEGDGLDVHPNPDGYRKFYSAAVLGAMEQNWDELIRRPEHQPIFCANDAAFLNGVYSYVECTDPRLSYSDGWRIYRNRLALWLDPSPDAIPPGFLENPHFEAGMAQAMRAPGASFSYETDADTVDMALASSVNGLSATVLCEGKACGELRCGSIYGNMDYPAGTAALPGDGKTHTVAVQVQDPTGEAYLFRFGYLIEFRATGAGADPT